VSEFVCRDGKRLQFEGGEDLAAWLAEEQERLQWITGKDAHRDWSQLKTVMQEGWNAVRAAIKSGDEAAMLSALENAYGASGSVVRSDSAEGVVLCRLAAQDSHAANAVLAILRGAAPKNKRSGNHIEDGYYAAAAMTASVVQSATGVLSGELESLRQRSETQVERGAKLGASFERDLAGWRTKAAGLVQSQEESFAELLLEWRRRAEALVQDAGTKFEDTQRYFKTELGLRAPVMYWESEAQRGEVGARIWGGLFFMVLVTAVVVLVLSADSLRQFVEVQEAGAAARLAILVAGGTLVFWLLRMVARIFLSNYHRSKDAAERVTMLKTFLALLQEERIERDMLPLVLGAVFRPGATGIVKDDAAPEYGPMAWLSKDRSGQ